METIEALAEAAIARITANTERRCQEFERESRAHYLFTVRSIGQKFRRLREELLRELHHG